MSAVEHKEGQFIVDGQVLAEAFNLTAEEAQQQMRENKITSLCEAGQDDDAGRWRLTFRHQGRALRLVVDDDGNILGKSTYPV